MNLQCARLHLAVVSPPPVVRSATRSSDYDDARKAANDNRIAWPLIPFPEGWCALN
jgi:hypothetical protein